MKRGNKIGLLLIGATIVHCALLYLHHELMEESQLIQTHEKMESLDSSPEILVLGNSHALAIQEEQFDDLVNLASYGEEIHQTYFRLNYIAREKKLSPQRLIISCDPGWLRDPKIDDQAYQWYWNNLEDEDLKSFSKSQFEFHSNRILSALFPYIHSEREAFDFLFGDAKKGDLRKEDKFIAREKLTVEKQLNDSCLEAQFSPLGMHYLDKILKVCETESIGLILLRFPLTPEYLFEQSTCYDPEAYYSRLMELINYENVNFIDLHSAFPPDDFRDPHHLKGGEPRQRLSRMLGDSLFN